MALQMQPKFILTEKFEKLKFSNEYQSVDTMSTPSTPSTPCSPPTDPYEIEVITEDDKDEVLDLLRKFFFRDEPLNVCIKLLENPTSTCPELEEYSMKDIGSGVNLKAVSNGKIIGISLNGIISRGYLEDIQEPDCPNEKFRKILKLLDHVAVESDVFSKYPGIDKAMIIRILSVDKLWRGRGVAKDLMFRTRDLAKEYGCGLMSVDCSSHYTAKGLKKLGFECIYTLNYDDYKVDGEIVFKPEEPHRAVTVYTQKIE